MHDSILPPRPLSRPPCPTGTHPVYLCFEDQRLRPALDLISRTLFPFRHLFLMAVR